MKEKHLTTNSLEDNEKVNQEKKADNKVQQKNK